MVLKSRFTTVCSWKKQNRFCCLPTHIREIWFSWLVDWTSTKNWVRDSTPVDFPAQSVVPSVLQSTSQWTCNFGTSKPVKCFDITIRRDIFIYPTRKDAVRHSRKIWRMQHESNHTSSANALMPRCYALMLWIRESWWSLIKESTFLNISFPMVCLASGWLKINCFT